MKTITNNIKCLNLQFINGIANTFINCPFLVNELQIVGLSLNMPFQATNTNNQISYSTASFTGQAIDTLNVFTGYIGATPINITGSIAGTVLTVASILTGAIAIGATISGISLTTIVSFGTGTGGTGTYNISISQTVALGTITVYNKGTELTVSTIPTTTIQIGAILTGIGIAPNTIVTSFLTGIGSVGTYTVSVAQSTISETITIPVSSNQLIVSALNGGAYIQEGMIIAGNGVIMNGSPIITSQISGTIGGAGTYMLNTPVIIAQQTALTGTIVIPVPLQELQAVIYSTLLPDCDSPIGYVTDNLIGGTESSSTSANIIYHFPQPKPIMGNFTFTMKDYTGSTCPFDLTAIVFIDFRNVRHT